VLSNAGYDLAGDINAPAINLFTLTVTDSSVELVWTSKNNSIKAASYCIYRDDTMIETTTSFTYIDTGLSSETNYTYYIKAKDSNGREIADSNIIKVVTQKASSAASELVPPADLTAEDTDLTTVDIIETSDMFTQHIVATTPSSVKYSILRSSDTDFETDRYIIKYKDNNGREKLKAVLGEKGLKSQKLKKDSDVRFDIISFEQKKKAGDLVRKLIEYKLESDIEYIQPDYQLTLSSNDPLFSTQWGLKNSELNEMNLGRDQFMQHRLDMLPPHLKDVIERSPELKDFLLNTPIDEIRDRLMAGDAPGNIPTELKLELAHIRPFTDMRDNNSNNMSDYDAYLCDAGVVEAWELSSGEGVVIAVINTGIDITHEDLAENIWVNTCEIPGNGIDDDKNGYIDDVNGWNFIDDTNQVFDSANAINESHGTQIAGIISAAKDNGMGISGVAPSAKIMPLKVFDNGIAYTSDIIDAILYAKNKGVKIVNCSWGSTFYNPALEEAMRDSDMLFVCAAGNSGADIDVNHIYPASFELSNIITVASVNKNRILSAFSNYGVINVDTAAPGEDIISTLPGNVYGEGNGTSMAAAFVSGEAALLCSILQDSSITEIKDRICMCSDRLSSLTGKISNSAKINCTAAIKNVVNDELITISNTIETSSCYPAMEDSDEFGLLSFQQLKGKFTAVACGRYHSLTLKNDGTVWAWGDNCYGQLGDGTTMKRTTAVQVSGLTMVTAIASGVNHSLAIRGGGTVWAWGENCSGQLGNGTTIDRTIALQVIGLSDITAIACGGYHSLALRNDGSVWAWGENYSGQLGDGTTVTGQ